MTTALDARRSHAAAEQSQWRVNHRIRGWEDLEPGQDPQAGAEERWGAQSEYAEEWRELKHEQVERQDDHEEGGGASSRCHC